MSEGCETLKKLYEIAFNDASISEPGIAGVPNRIVNFWKSDNIQWSMQIAALKCWEERTMKEFPPIVVGTGSKVAFEYNSKSSSSKSSNSSSSKNN